MFMKTKLRITKQKPIRMDFGIGRTMSFKNLHAFEGYIELVSEMKGLGEKRVRWL